MENKREEILSRLEAIKQEKKQLKKQLKELPNLEVGKWYKYPNHENWLLCIVGFKDGMVVNSYGFDCNSGWMDGWNQKGITEMGNVTPATDKEVETALIAEAKKRGFKKGVRYKSLYNDYDSGMVNNSGLIYKSKINCLYVKSGEMIDVIFRKGNWAEIIEEPKTVHIPSGDYTETQLKDILNNLYEK